MAVKGILFDSGGTLVGPRGGRWNPRFDFEEVLARHLGPFEEAVLADAIGTGATFLSECRETPSRDDYHRAILAALGIAAPSAELLQELDRPTRLPVLEPFPETEDVLNALSDAGVRMCIVSDNWRGLETLYADLELAHHFSLFVISEVLGCAKPDPRMYKAGADGLGLAPSDCLFVDDDADLVRAAVALGYQGAHIDRSSGPAATDLRVIRDLWPLLDLVQLSEGSPR